MYARHTGGFVPSKQGSLDNLCGVYCLVNAVAYLFEGEFKQRYRLKQHLLKLYDQKWPLRDLMFFGTETEQLEHMIQQGLMRGKYAEHFPIKFNQPFKEKRFRTANAILNEIQRFLSKLGAKRVVIIGTPYHWTLVRKIDKKRVYFIDSSTLNTAFRSSFRFEEEGRLELLKDEIYFLEKLK
ncbi:hypothetical protein [Thiomicrorhabdus indica]|uniref:hypothetical protein n=1 Tax=Thiomicrorhabdus indica TaxID=2267253 RepID=UPI00102D8069|nr:hypothetical protein [Thiomicrorhabdus indica]